MSAPLYFLPHVKQSHVTPGLLKDRGLGDLIRDARFPEDVPRYDAPTGPGGLPGCILSINSPGRLAPARFGHYPEANAWHRITDALWLGLTRDDAIEPADVQRPGNRSNPAGEPLPPHPGHRVKLHNGHTWEIPAVRRPFSEGTTLPRFWSWDEGGAFSERIDPRYQAAWDATAELSEVFYNPDHPRTLQVEQIAALCVLALSINYRVDRALQSHARLFSSDDWEPILGALVDWPTYLSAVAASKKAAPATSRPAAAPPPTPPAWPNTPPGPTADSPTIAPPAAS